LRGEETPTPKRVLDELGPAKPGKGLAGGPVPLGAV